MTSDFRRCALIYLAASAAVGAPLIAVWWFALGTSRDSIVIATAACVLGALITILRRYRGVKRETLPD